MRVHRHARHSISFPFSRTFSPAPVFFTRPSSAIPRPQRRHIPSNPLNLHGKPHAPMHISRKRVLASSIRYTRSRRSCLRGRLSLRSRGQGIVRSRDYFARSLRCRCRGSSISHAWHRRSLFSPLTSPIPTVMRHRAPAHAILFVVMSSTFFLHSCRMRNRAASGSP